MLTRQAIIAQARSWKGTAFKHQGRVKKQSSLMDVWSSRSLRASAILRGGVDCIGLIVGVAKELNIPSTFHLGVSYKPLCAFDQLDYGREPDGKMLKQRLDGCMVEISTSEVCPGDMVLFRLKRDPQHVALLTDHSDGLGMIHAYEPNGQVVEHRLDAKWKRRIVAAYRFPHISI